MREVIARLASDEFEGRAPGARAEDLTITEIISRFKAAGLEPGSNGQWLQEVPTVDITAKDVSPLTVSGGGAKPLRFAYGSDFVAGSYRVTPQTRIADSEMVFVGYGIVAPELGWNDYAGLDMKGKTAVILVNDPDYAMEGEDGPFKGRRMTYYGRWTYKFEEAARQGAAAALIVHDTFPAAYGWNVVNSSWTNTQHYVRRPDNAMGETQANAWIQKPVAEAILASAGKDLAALSTAAGQKGFKPVPLGLKASLSFANTIETGVSHNVIGILPGTTRKDEYVLTTAHWDHLGRCNADNTGDDICNGAVDNASGIAGLVALADMNHRAGPARRSQVFAAVTLEESGLLGSEWYARNPVFPLDRTVGGVNIDGLAPIGPSRDVTATGGDKSELTGILRQTLATMGLRLSPEAYAERGGYYRSDHFSLAKRGVPMFRVGRGLDLVEGGIEAGKAAADDYTKNRYHQPGDEYSPDWNFTGIAQETELLYRLGRTLAEGTTWPNWYPGDEFRAVRDKSCAAGPGGC
ncbi:M28 family peptidase [Novosphingobium sp. Gsoil 351]|uniref:M28 family peptidase n=1 Tax=Novosphingobium sp. Gsoil 351 TaxID=2675225 RepID=UPI001E62271E|nr:M28 family peptidase [Novosphingobium sp. Gsoil 351]